MFAIIRGKHLCWTLFLTKMQAWRLQQQCFLVNIAKVLRTAFFIEHLCWVLLITAIIQRYFAKQLLQNSKDNMLHNSIDMKVYALQLKQKSTVGFLMKFYEILEELVLRIILGGCFWKENRGGEGCAVTLVVSSFHFFQGSYLFIKPWSYVLSLQIFT